MFARSPSRKFRTSSLSVGRLGDQGIITSFIIHNLGWQARALVPAIFVSTRYTWFRVGSCPPVPFPKPTTDQSQYPVIAPFEGVILYCGGVRPSAGNILIAF